MSSADGDTSRPADAGEAASAGLEEHFPGRRIFSRIEKIAEEFAEDAGAFNLHVHLPGQLLQKGPLPVGELCGDINHYVSVEVPLPPGTPEAGNPSAPEGKDLPGLGARRDATSFVRKRPGAWSLVPMPF